jgi:hypothetical protein
VSIDGNAVPAKLVRHGRDVQMVACTEPLTLGAGEHHIDIANGRTTGIDVNRLVLDSNAAPTAPPEATDQPGAGTQAPNLVVRRTGATGYRIDVTTTAGTGSPYWLVLGQSNNAGWHARIDQLDLGPSTLVDGYANGWLVTPRSPSYTITLTWTPQRMVGWALVVSASAAIVCAGIVVLSWRRRSASRPWATIVRRPDVRAGPRPRKVQPAVVVALLGALLCSGWVAGGIVALALTGAQLAHRRLPPRWAASTALVPAALLALVAAFVVAKQVRYHLPTDLDWPGAFDAVQPLAWAAVFSVVPLWPGRPIELPTHEPGPVDDDRPRPEPGAHEVPVTPVVPAAPRRSSASRGASWPPGRRSGPDETDGDADGDADVDADVDGDGEADDRRDD